MRDEVAGRGPTCPGQGGELKGVEERGHIRCGNLWRHGLQGLGASWLGSRGNQKPGVQEFKQQTAMGPSGSGSGFPSLWRSFLAPHSADRGELSDDGCPGRAEEEGTTTTVTYLAAMAGGGEGKKTSASQFPQGEQHRHCCATGES